MLSIPTRRFLYGAGSTYSVDASTRTDRLSEKPSDCFEIIVPFGGVKSGDRDAVRGDFPPRSAVRRRRPPGRACVPPTTPKCLIDAVASTGIRRSSRAIPADHPRDDWTMCVVGAGRHMCHSTGGGRIHRRSRRRRLAFPCTACISNTAGAPRCAWFRLNPTTFSKN